MECRFLRPFTATLRTTKRVVVPFGMFIGKGAGRRMYGLRRDESKCKKDVIYFALSFKIKSHLFSLPAVVWEVVG